MKKVEAIVLKSKVAVVCDALANIGIRHVSNVALRRDSSKAKIGVIVPDEITPQVVSTIESAAR